MPKKRSAEEVPEGVAVLPLIPPTAGVKPLFLAVLHALVFLEGSAETVVNRAAADEALEYMVSYLQQVSPEDYASLQENTRRLLTHARRRKWSQEKVHFLQTFLHHYGIG